MRNFCALDVVHHLPNLKLVSHTGFIGIGSKIEGPLYGKPAGPRPCEMSSSEAHTFIDEDLQMPKFYTIGRAAKTLDSHVGAINAKITQFFHVP